MKNKFVSLSTVILSLSMILSGCNNMNYKDDLTANNEMTDENNIIIGENNFCIDSVSSCILSPYAPKIVSMKIIDMHA